MRFCVGFKALQPAFSIWQLRELLQHTLLLGHAAPWCIIQNLTLKTFHVGGARYHKVLARAPVQFLLQPTITLLLPAKRCANPAPAWQTWLANQRKRGWAAMMLLAGCSMRKALLR